MIYFNYDEIVTALTLLAEANPDLTTLIALPNLTDQGRPSYAISVGNSRDASVETIVALGGVHAREWVPPDALISLLADLLAAYKGGFGLGYGGTKYSAETVARVIEELQIVLFPCVNPDGRVHSQTRDAMWRKNRRVNHTHADDVCYGVDLNRNFDILWDFETHFHSGSVASSNDPCDRQLYVGPTPASEPETQNVVWLIDQFPLTSRFVDVHSYIPGILHSWGIDENQSEQPDQTFANPDFDGQRGVPNDSYGEFISSGDARTIGGLARLMRDAASNVAGDSYDIGPAFNLYATSGASHDYAYSRHHVLNDNAKIFGFTMECGHTFQPDPLVREQNIKEVSAALLALAAESTKHSGDVAS